MFLNYLINNFWFSALIVSILYISDYFFTLKNSELYQKNTKNFIELEGGVELNPLYRKDINKLKKFNSKFFIALIGLNLLLLFVWYTSVAIGQSANSLEFFLGAFILTEFFIHTRHIRSYFQNRAALKPGDIEGHLKYSRSFMHKSAAVDALVFAVIYFIFWALVGRQFFLGGAFTCLVLALAQKFWLKNYLKNNW